MLAQRIKEVQDKGVEDVCKEGINYNDGPMESKICSEGNKDVRKETGSIISGTWNKKSLFLTHVLCLQVSWGLCLL